MVRSIGKKHSLSKGTALSIIQTVERGTDPDRLSEILSSPASVVTVESVGKEAISFDCTAVSLGKMSFVNSTYEGHIRNTRQGAGDSLLIVFPRKGVATIRGHKQDLMSVPGTGIIVDALHNKGFSMFEPRSHLIAALPRAELTSRLSRLLELSVGDDFGFKPEIDLGRGAGSLLNELAGLMYNGVTDDVPKPPVVLGGLVDVFFDIVLHSLHHAHSDRLSTRASAPSPRHVKKAIDYMRSHLSEAISLDQIAAASGVSPRSLQEGFRQFKSTTPMRYLRDLRLESVRQGLLLGPSTGSVSDAARACGFVQLGRFAADYYARFGELPSQTVRGQEESWHFGRDQTTVDR